MSDIFIELCESTMMGARQLSRINYNLFFLPAPNENKISTIEFKGSEIKVNNKKETKEEPSRAEEESPNSKEE